jgi:hypothetical protein
MSTVCSVFVKFDKTQVFIRELHVEGLNAEEVQGVTSKLLNQIIPQVEAIALLSRMSKVIEEDNAIEAETRVEIVARLEELKQILVGKEPEWKNARELLALIADITSIAPLIGYLQQILPLLRL